MEVLTANEVANILKVSVSKAYKIIAQLNKELAAKGKLVVRGRVSKRYFEERIGM